MHRVQAILVGGWMAVAASLLHGCATSPPPVAAGASSEAAVNRAGEVGERAARGQRSEGSGQRGQDSRAAIHRITNTDNGLEVRRWTILASGSQVRDVLGTYAEGRALDPLAMDRLRRNGFRFVRVPLIEIESVLADLGGATMNRTEWHGQATEWRSLQDRPVDPQGQAVAIDGRVRRYDRGEFRLAIRSWTAPMEDGPQVHLEVLPQLAATTRGRGGNLQRILGQDSAGSDQIEAFTAMALDVQLHPGYAYVLLSESPQTEWPEIEGAGVSGGDVGARGAPGRATGGGRGGRMGPLDGIGPESAPPLTIGELMLPSELSPPRRDVLIFVPHVPAELLPPDLAGGADRGRSAGEAG